MHPDETSLATKKGRATGHREGPVAPFGHAVGLW